jgi:hypothetical protein
VRRVAQSRAYRRGVRAFLTPKWVGAHLLLVAVCAAMIRLGIWQWHVGGVRHGDLRNYAYALQWWAFTGFAIFFWARLIRDARRPAAELSLPPPAAAPDASQSGAPEEGQYRPYVMPRAGEATPADVDPELARYNAYLRSLEDT